MLACPGRRMKRGSEPVASFDGRNEPLLIGEDGRQPQLAKQRVARSEAVVERALWSFQALRDGIDRHGSGTPFASQRAGRSEKACTVEARSPHLSRLYGLDFKVKIRHEPRPRCC